MTRTRSIQAFDMPVFRAVAVILSLSAFLAASLPLRGLRVLGVGVPAWLPMLFCRLMLGALRVRLAIRGEQSRAPGRLVVANHVSWIDILALGAVEPLCFLAKCEVATWPGIGPLARLLDTLFVDRARRMTIPRINRDLAARLAGGRTVLLFPEGTTGDGVTVGPFKTAHLACLRDLAAAPSGPRDGRVQPVLVAYSEASAAWTGDATLLPHLWSVLSGPALRCTLVYGDTVTMPAGHDRKVLGRDLREAIEGLRPLAQAEAHRPEVPDVVGNRVLGASAR